MSNTDKVVSIEQQTVESKIKWPIEYVTMETVSVPDYSYGNGNEELDYNTALRNKPTIINPLLFIWM